MAQRGVQTIGAEEKMPATVEKIDEIGREFIEKYYDAIQGKAGAWRLNRFYEEKSRYLRFDGQPEREASRANRIVRLITKMRIERQTIAKIEAIFTVEPQPNRFTVVAVGWMSRARRDETHKFVHSTVMIMPPPSAAGQKAYSIVWTVFKFADPAVDDYFFGASTETSTKAVPNVRRLTDDGDKRVVDEPSSTSFGQSRRNNRRNEYDSSTPGEMVGRVDRKPRVDRRQPFDVPIGKAGDDAAKAGVSVVPKQNSMAIPKPTYRPSNSNNMPIDKSVVRLTPPTAYRKHPDPPQNTKPDVLKSIPIFNDKTYPKIMTKNNTSPLGASSVTESIRAPDQENLTTKNMRKKMRKMGGDSLTEKMQTVQAEPPPPPPSRPIKCAKTPAEQTVVRPTNDVKEETSAAVARDAWTLVEKKPSRSSNGEKLVPKAKRAAPRQIKTGHAKPSLVPADAKPIKSLKKLIGYASLGDTA